MGVFVLAGLIFVVGLGVSALVLMGESQGVNASWAAIFVGKVVIAGLALASHWILAVRS